MKKIELLHGDCLEIMKSIPDKSIDLVLTDPPYGTTACKWDSVIPFEPMWKELRRICKWPVLLFGSEPFSSNLRMSNINEFKYDWIWDKVQPGGFFTVKHKPMAVHEIVSVFGSGFRYFRQMDEKSKASLRLNQVKNKLNQKNKTVGEVFGKSKQGHAKDYDPTKTNPKSIIRFSKRPTLRTEKYHPTQKPVALLEYLIKTYTLEGETVLDFTMGSGSTGVACKNLNRKFIGIEKDLTYYDIATKRIYESLVVKG